MVDNKIPEPGPAKLKRNAGPDEWLEAAKDCKYLSEQHMKQLCEIADAEFAADETLRGAYPQCPAAREAHCRSLITFVKDRPGHDRRYAIDLSKAAREVNYSPAVSLDTGLRQVFRWYAENRSWWMAVMDGSYRDWLDSNYSSRRSSRD